MSTFMEVSVYGTIPDDDLQFDEKEGLCAFSVKTVDESAGVPMKTVFTSCMTGRLIRCFNEMMGNPVYKVFMAVRLGKDGPEVVLESIELDVNGGNTNIYIRDRDFREKGFAF